jgi:hypothetical protein
MISKLPKGLKVGGSLVISYTSIGILPKGLEVGGVIYAINSHIFNIDEIPKGVITEGIVTINKLILNSNLTISSDLHLQHTKIPSLPEGLKVGKHLFLGYSEITSLPEGLNVGEHLFLGYSKITSLPKGLEVFGGLYIKNAPLTKYTDEQLREMVKPGHINRIMR